MRARIRVRVCMYAFMYVQVERELHSRARVRLFMSRSLLWVSFTHVCLFYESLHICMCRKNVSSTLGLRSCVYMLKRDVF